MNVVEELKTELFGANRTALSGEFEKWATDSKRFRAFAGEYRTKIRAKLKNVRDEGGLQDVRAELEAALLLLAAERFTLEYEKYAALKQRGPDFTVTYKTHTPFNVEVRRIRRLEMDTNAEARTIKLITVLCDKVRQMPPSIVNLLWLTAEREISEADLTRAVNTLRQRAERRENEFFIPRGFENAADFFRYYNRLSGIILHGVDGNDVWLNAQARHPVPPEIVNTLRRLV